MKLKKDICFVTEQHIRLAELKKTAWPIVYKSWNDFPPTYEGAFTASKRLIEIQRAA